MGAKAILNVPCLNLRLSRHPGSLMLAHQDTRARMPLAVLLSTQMETQILVNRRMK